MPQGLNEQRISINLGPTILRACNMTGKRPPITSAINSEFPVWMIGITPCFPNLSNKKSNRYHKRGRGKIKIFLDWIYHPVENDDQKRFNEELASFYNNILSSAKLLSGQDVNPNIGVLSKMFRDVIGPNRIDNRNTKGKKLLFLLAIIKFRVL